MAPSAGEAQGNSDSREREIAVARRQLDPGAREARRRRRDPDAHDQLVVLEARHERHDEELGRRARPRVAVAGNLDRRVEGGHHGGKLGRGIGVGEAAADRAPVADRGVSDPGQRFREEMAALAHERVVLGRALPRQRADA